MLTGIGASIFHLLTNVRLGRLCKSLLLRGIISMPSPQKMPKVFIAHLSACSVEDVHGSSEKQKV